MLDEVALKTVHKDKKVYLIEEKEVRHSEVKSVENISKNRQFSRDKSRTKGSPSFT